MNLEFIARAMLSGIVLYFVLFVLIVQWQRARWRRSKRRGRGMRFYPTTMMIGLALQSLQTFAQPEVHHTLEEKYADEAEEDDEGDSDDPAKTLHAQLRQIRNGKQAGQLRVPLHGPADPYIGLSPDNHFRFVSGLSKAAHTAKRGKK